MLNRLAIAVVIFFSIVIGYAAWSLWMSADDAAYESCMASMFLPIDVAESRLRKNGESLFEKPPGETWRSLSDNEVRRIEAVIGPTDCGPFPIPFVDRWGQRINMAVKKGSGGMSGNDVFIWSNGSDGVAGTDDDLVVPHGRTLPPSLSIRRVEP